jgi:hypothetical protein
MSVIGGNAGGGLHASISFAIPALLIVGAGIAVILYQHTLHTSILLNALGASAGGSSTASLAAQPSQGGNSIYASGAGQSPASGIFTPLGPSPNESSFPFMPTIGGNTQ